MVCDNCGSKESIVKKHKHEYLIKGKKVSFVLERRFCKKCNCLVYDDKLDNDASIMGLLIYSEQYGITKEQIINLRKNYGLSLDLFSKIIGCAKKTLISYEQGRSVPNDSYLIILKYLLSNPKAIYGLIEANKEQFNDKEYQKIINTINKNESNLSNNKIDFIEEEYDLSKYNGYTKYSKDKIYNVILFFAKNKILKTKLLKEMFYADFINYKETGASITGLEYAKLPFGPVPEDFDNILYKAMFDDCIDYNIEYKNQYEYNYIKSKKEFNKSLFTKDELNVLQKVKDKFKDYSSKDIVEYSHKEQAYLKTKELQKISYDYAFDINID